MSSFDTPPVTAGSTPGAAPRSKSSPADPAPCGPAEDSIAVEAVLPVPPLEVMEAMVAAQRAYEELAATGRTLQFDLDPHAGRLSIRLMDAQGTPLREISPSNLLAIAGGAPPDPGR